MRMNGKRKLIGSFNHGSMASALPQAIGAKVSAPDKEVIALCGDGGFAMLMLIDKTGLYTNYFATICQRDYDIIFQCIHQGIAKGELEVHDVDILTNTIIIFMEGTIIQAKMNNLNFEQTQSRLTKYITFLLDQYTRKEPWSS